MGDFATSKTNNNAAQQAQQKSTTNPWGPQASHLKTIFDQAGQAFNQARSNPFTGDVVAGYRPEQLQTFQDMLGYSSSSPVGSFLESQGTNLGTLGQTATGAGLGGLQAFNPTDTAATIQSASQYADNPYMSGMVDAAMRDANRNVYEQVIPGNQQQAARSGNTNSSRTAMKEAIAERGLADRYADVSSQLRGSAYQQGIGATQNANAQELSRLGSLTNSGLGSAGLGASNLDNSIDAMRDLFGIGTEAGAGLRDSDQAKLDNNLAKWQMDQQQAWAPLQQYLNIIGARNWGGTTTGTSSGNTRTNSEQTPSMAQQLGGVFTGLGGLPWGAWG